MSLLSYIADIIVMGDVSFFLLSGDMSQRNISSFSPIWDNTFIPINFVITHDRKFQDYELPYEFRPF